MAALLGIPFIDAKGAVRFQGGRLDSEQTFSLMAAALKGKKRAVIAGFYGADEEGNVHTFPAAGATSQARSWRARSVRTSMKIGRM